ncbi:MAG: hypothetical protein ACK2UK_00855 [Candidatus Promineifilaceae bacterium]
MSGFEPAGKRLAVALGEFRAARRQAALKAALARLQGDSLALLSFYEVAKQLKVTGQVDRGVREIPLDRIVGSVGRYDDFDRSFLPLKDHDAKRWASVRIAAADPAALPPIEVYQIGTAYFVVDGNHRVSIALRLGLDYLDAHVVEIRSRVPLPDDLDYEAFILAAEYAAFLEHTGLDHLYPEVTLAVSMPGQYDKLENHIEVNRYFIEEADGRTLSDEEAVGRWYANVYLPVVESIREHGLLRGFDGRTETDLYLWIAENQAALRNALGWNVSTEAATPDAARYAAVQGNRLARLYRRALSAALPAPKYPPELAWSYSKTMDRYSDRLFADILVGVDATSGSASWVQALPIAEREQSHLLGVPLLTETPEGAGSEQLRSNFYARLQELGLSGELSRVSGPLLETIRFGARLADLLVLARKDLREIHAGGENIRQLIVDCNRPLLIALEEPSRLTHALLLCGSEEASQEALFVTAYMAERWGCSVTLLSGPDSASASLERARRYLELHEIEAATISRTSSHPDIIFKVAHEHDCDLVVGGAQQREPLHAEALLRQLLDGPEARLKPLLLCP